ncbi:FixH family protein [Pleionea sp. CnH1-48]|uniref:FixH family protein n=1 Tax=Pleionea sp. CnH1-48 TaxID=2954494 RepID=UPI0020973250|nr:FixH family protein [Pleionea sp. CnH1-48]MCO7223939.1 FixH family protein [Pleionea sp. CnH1-48]
MEHPQDTKPWYKQFYPWMIIALPASSVVAGITTVIIATTGADSMVKADYYKEGLAINESIEKREKAAELQLKFDIEYQAPDAMILTSAQPLDVPVLYLSIQHPAKEHKDQVVVLNRTEDSLIYKGQSLPLEPVNYRLKLSTPTQDWEMMSRWPLKQSNSIQLKPR